MITEVASVSARFINKRDKGQKWTVKSHLVYTNAIIAAENFNYYLVAGHGELGSSDVVGDTILLAKWTQLIPAGKS